jgi:hypothetical protein
MGYRCSGRQGHEVNKTLPFYRVLVDALPAGMASFSAVSDL